MARSRARAEADAGHVFEEARAVEAEVMGAWRVEAMGADECRRAIDALSMPEKRTFDEIAQEARASAEIANYEALVNRQAAARPVNRDDQEPVTSKRKRTRQYDLSRYYSALSWFEKKGAERAERERRTALLKARLDHLERMAELQSTPGGGPSPLESYLAELRRPSE